MIVACPQCSKKFKLNDDKVAAGNVKLKCTGCETVFEVKGGGQEAVQYEIQSASGAKLGPISLEDVKQKVEAGIIGADAMVAGPDEPFSPITEHPATKSLQFPDSQAQEDDLFGGGSSGNDEDLFGGGGSDEDLFGADSDSSDDDLFGDGGSDDDLFGDANPPANSGTDDDLFGGDNKSDDDLFGDSESSDDDLFGDQSSSSDDDLFGDSGSSEDSNDDLFGDSSSGSDDMFEDGSDDGDLFGEAGDDDDLFSESSGSSDSPASDDNFLGGDAADDPFDSDNEGSLFDDDLVDDASSGADDLFDSNSDETYDEDIEEKLDSESISLDTPPSAGVGSSLFADDELGGQDLVTDGAELDDLAALPFDLPTAKTSKTTIFVGIGILVLVLAAAGAIFFAPDPLHGLPGVGTGIEKIHQSLNTTWYQNLQLSRIRSELRTLPVAVNSASAREAFGLEKKHRTPVSAHQELQEHLLPYIVFAYFSEIVEETRMERVSRYKGPLGEAAQILLLKGENLTIDEQGEWGIYLKALQAWKNDKISVAQKLLDSDEKEEHKFLVSVTQALIQLDLQSYRKAISFYENALDAQPDTVFPQLEIAKIYWELDNVEKTAEELSRIDEDADMDSVILARFLSLQGLVWLAKDDKAQALEYATRAHETDKANANAAAVRAKILNASGDSIKALLLLEDYRNSHPNNYDVRLQYALGQQAMGRPELAIEDLLLAVEANQIRTEAPLALVRVYSEQKQWTKAEAILEEQLLRLPNDPDVNLSAGEYHMRRQELKKAESYFAKAVNGDSENPEVLALAGKLALEQNQLTTAERYLEKARKLAPENTNVQLELGQVLLKRKKFKDAENIYLTLLGEQPQNPDILLALAKIKYYENDDVTSEEFLREAIKYRLSLHEGYYYLSLLYKRKSNYRDAITRAKEAIEHGQYLKYRMHLADLYELDKRPGVALVEYEAILKDYSNNVQALWKAVELNSLSRQYAEAEVHLNTLKRLLPKSGKVYATLARTQILAGNGAAAQKTIATGLKIAPYSVLVLNVAGQIALDQQDYKAAKKHLLRAVSQSPKNAETRYWLGFYYKSGEGKLDRAQVEFKRAIALGLDDTKKLVAKGEIDALRYR